MRRETIVIIMLLLLSCAVLTAFDFASWVTELAEDKSISNDALYAKLKWRTEFPEPQEKNILLEELHVISDSLKAPFLYFIPPNYQTTKKTPLFIYLHGGVSMPTFIEDYYDQMKDSSLLELARQENMIMLFPAGNIDTVWWSKVGIENIRYQVRFLKDQTSLRTAVAGLRKADFAS